MLANYSQIVQEKRPLFSFCNLSLSLRLFQTRKSDREGRELWGREGLSNKVTFDLGPE